MAGAPFGNRNGAKQRQFYDTLRRAIAADDGKMLRAAAERLLKKASTGDLWAIKELADRLDGKSTQPVEFTNVTPQDLSDERLADIAAGGSAGVAQTPASPPESAGLH